MVDQRDDTCSVSIEQSETAVTRCLDRAEMAVPLDLFIGGREYLLACFIDQSVIPFEQDTGPSFGKIIGPIVMKRDHLLAGVVQIAPTVILADTDHRFADRPDPIIPLFEKSPIDHSWGRTFRRY